MPGRTIARATIVVAVMLLALPVAAADPIPEVASFTWTPNMNPLGASPRPIPDVGVFNTDLAFWGDRAFQGTYDGFRIIDISESSAPGSIIDYTGCSGVSASGQGDVIVWEDLLVRSWNSNNQSPTRTCDGESVPVGFEGVHIFDVSDPTDPDLVGSVQLACGSHTATGVPDLANNRLLVYNNASSATCPWIDILEVPLDDPSSAAQLGVAPAGRSCHDTAVILGSAMLAACAGSNGFTVFSIGGARGGSLETPAQLYSKTMPVADNITIGHAATFSWDGEVLAFGHEPGGGTAPECEATDADSKKTLFFFNAVDGTELGRWVLPRPQTAQENCTIHNFNTVPVGHHRILVSGNYQSGIAVVDFTDPSQPKEIAYADPAPLQPQQSGGDWSTYWYDGHIYEGDITRGLITWDLLDPAVAGALTLGHSNPQTQEQTIPFTGVIPLGKPAPSECKGQTATVVGTTLPEKLKGTKAADVISAGDGNDTVAGAKGNDLVCGGSGNDGLRGGKGKDTLLGEIGKDRLQGGDGTDRCTGGANKDKGSETCEKGKV